MLSTQIHTYLFILSSVYLFSDNCDLHLKHGICERHHMGTQTCHKCRFLEHKEGQLELVFEDNFCQLHPDVVIKCS